MINPNSAQRLRIIGPRKSPFHAKRKYLVPILARWVCAIFCFLLHEDSAVAGSGWTGNDLVPMIQASERVVGGMGQRKVNDIRDASLVAGYCLGVSECLPNLLDGDVGQLVGAVGKFLRANPKRLNENAAVLVADAIEQEWPRKKE